MKSPITGKKMSVAKRESSLTFRKEQFLFVSQFYHCYDSGEEFTSTELDESNLLQVENQYRERYNIPFPSEIRCIRQTYQLSAEKVSEILGFESKSYGNYENGEVPSISNGKLIRKMKDTRKFRGMIELCESLTLIEKTALLSHLDDIIMKDD